MHSKSSTRTGKSRWEIFEVCYSADRSEWRVDEHDVVHDDALFETKLQAKEYKKHKEYNGPD